MMSCRRLSIQKFIVSQRDELAASRPASEPRAASRGSMLPRKTNGALRNCSGIFGRKFEKTPRCVSSVSADVQVVAIAAAPAKRRTLGRLEPGEIHGTRRERAFELVDRVVAADDADELHRATSGSPTAEKNVPEPPSTFSALPNGVSTESSATEPTTRTVIGLSWLLVG